MAAISPTASAGACNHSPSPSKQDRYKEALRRFEHCLDQSPREDQDYIIGQMEKFREERCLLDPDKVPLEEIEELAINGSLGQSIREINEAAKNYLELSGYDCGLIEEQELKAKEVIRDFSNILKSYKEKERRKITTALDFLEKYQSEALEVFFYVIQHYAQQIVQIEITRTIDKYIESRDIQNLRSFFDSNLRDRQKLSIDDYLSKSTEYLNLKTLLSQVIKQAPKCTNGIVENKDREESFFEDKTLFVCDPETSHFYAGLIIRCKKRTDSFQFFLDNKSQILICLKSSKVTIIDREEYLLSNGLFNGSLRKGDHIDLRFKPHHGLAPERIIPEGKYKINYITKEKIGWPWGQHYCTVCALTAGIGKGRRTYKIYFGSKEKDAGQRSYIDLVKIVSYPYRVEKECSAYRVEKECSGYMFTRNCLAALDRIVSLQGINCKNINDSVNVRNEIDESKIKLRYLEEIKKIFDMLRSKLEKNTFLFEALLIRIVNSKLRGDLLDLDIVEQRDGEFLEQIKELSDKYEQYLQAKNPPEKIIAQMVREINYQQLINKGANLQVARTMSLLQESEKHVSALSGVDTILFMGKTGAGKSTVVSYLLGAKMEAITTRLGDNVIQINEEERSNYPTIGQSIGESETLYATAYKVNSSEPITLCDCPGFDDTRGEDHEICTNLSVDRAVEKSRSIRSIVAVIPAAAFLTDRANSVIDTIQTIQDLFPFTFNSERIEDNARVYVLITKQTQINQNAVEALENGERVEKFLQEAERTLQSELARDQDRNLVTKETAFYKRKQIWSTIRSMYLQKKVDLVDVEDEYERKKLFKKYTCSGFVVDKRQYVKAMQGKNMQAKFGKSIEMATDTWSNHIMRTYMEVIPKDLKDFSEIIDGKVLPIEKLRSEISELRESVKESQMKCDELSNGVFKEDLWEIDYRGKEKEEMEIFTYKKKGGREEAFKRGHLQKEDKTDIRNVSIGSYKGKLGFLAFISRDYRLVPKDPVQRKQFTDTFSRSDRVTLGKYSAELYGDGFEIDLGIIPYGQGKKIAYGIQTHWDGKKMPWCKISHIIPNTDYNEAQIINLDGKAHALLEEIAKREQQLEIQSSGIEEIVRKAKKDLNDTFKKKKRLAFAISNEWESAKLLRTFAELAILGSDCLSVGETKQSLLSSCREFTECYDRYHQQIKAEVEKDLVSLSF